MKKQLLKKKTSLFLSLISLGIGFVILVSSGAVHAELIFYDNFSSDTGWTFTLGSDWERSPAAVSSGEIYGSPDPATDHTPSESSNMVIGADVGGNTSTLIHDFWYAISPVIDCTGYMNVNIEYYRWLNSDSLPYMQNTIDVFDGSSWNNVWQTEGSPGVQDRAWTLQQFDVSSYADGNASFQLRFGHSVMSVGVFTVSGWNVDDVSIFGDPVPIPSAVWLLGSGLIGIVGIRRRFRS